jgi:hypothetical protein
MGGEPCRLLWLPPAARRSGLAALLVDRALFLIASAAFLCFGVVAALALPRLLPRLWLLVAASAVLGTFALGVMVALRTARGGLVGPIERILARLRLRRRATGAGDAIDGLVAESFRGPRGPLLAGLATHLVGRALLAAEVWAGLWVLGAKVPASKALVLASVPIVLGVFGSVVPSQIGVQEGAQALVCGGLGVDPAIGLSVVLLQRVRQIASVSIAGGLLWLRRGAPAVPEPAPVVADVARAPGRR